MIFTGVRLSPLGIRTATDDGRANDSARDGCNTRLVLPLLLVDERDIDGITDVPVINGADDVY